MQEGGERERKMQNRRQHEDKKGGERDRWREWKGRKKDERQGDKKKETDMEAERGRWGGE